MKSNQVGSSVNVVGASMGPLRHLSLVQQYEWTIPSDLDNHFKPLDIVWVKCLNSSGFRYYHVGIVLGNNQICEFSRKENGTRITNWQSFLEDTTKKIIRFHPIIPFKKYDKIVREITWAVSTNYRGGEYNLLNKNCEHLGNMLVYGIDYSKQIEEKKYLEVRECLFPLTFFCLIILILLITIKVRP